MGNVAQVDYIIVHQAGLNLQELLSQKLVEAFENAYIELPKEDGLPKVPENVLAIRYTKSLSKSVKQAFSGVSLYLEQFDDGEVEIAKLVSDFSALISSAQKEGIIHVVKLYDQKLHLEHAQYAQEIFEIEMKLREVFSVIFIDTYETGFHNLLNDVVVPLSEKPQESQMLTRLENQFFYLTFSGYKNLNDKKKIGIDQMVKLLGQVSDFGSFQARLTQLPVQKEEYADFITSLKAIVDPIDKLRNCVAHNRTIPAEVKENYSEAKKKLTELIDEFLATLPKVK